MRLPHLASFALAPIAAVALGGCPSAPPDDVVTQWRAEADAHGPMGEPGSFRLQGNEVVSGFSDALALTAPFSAALRVDATMAEGTGSLHCTQPVSVSAGVIQNVAVTEVRTVAGGGAELRFFSPSEDAPARAEGLVIDDVTGCTLNVGNDFLDVTGSVTTSGELDALSLVVDAATLAGGAPLELAFAEVGVGGDGAGSVTFGDDGVVADAQAVFGVASTVRIDGDAVEGEGNITQVITAEGPAIDADVELVATGTEDVVVTQGDKAPIPLAFREKSYAGDALLAAYAVEGPDAAAIELATAKPAGFVGELFASVEEAGIAAPFVAIAVVATLPFAIAADIVTEIFNPEVRPVPFPAFARAGTVGAFSVVVNGAELAPGAYEATLVVGGQNFAEQRVDLRWTVVAPE